jgi:aerobic-type carbon monoxide dehydrogenase small subunit (CoxS/CutS family)
METVMRIKVNGRSYEVRVSPNSTLQDVLRKELGLTSLKDMCLGHGACGSCTVLLEGRPVLSCMTLALDCEGKEVETVEGISASGHPLIDSFLDNHAFQCGYCTPGFVVTAKALLDRNPRPTAEEIVEALGGNICRCGAYPAVISAVQQASENLERHGHGEEKKN